MSHLRQKIGHFKDILPSQSLGLVLKKLNLLVRQQKQTQKQNGKNTGKASTNMKET